MAITLSGSVLLAGSTTINETEFAYLDSVTAGTSAASKAMVTDASGDLLMPDSDKFELGASSDMQLYHDGTNSYIANKTGALKIATETPGIAVTIGNADSEVTIADNLTVSGDLTVTGNTVTNQVEVISTSTGVLFEGGVDDGHEATLKSAVAGADVTYTLPNLTGHVPLLAGAASNASVTAAEFALLDGGSSIGTTAVADGHGLYMNQGGTMAHTTVQTLAAYLDDEITAMPNLVTVGTIGSGTWQGGVIASAYLDADTAHLSTAQTFTGAKTFTADVTAGVDGTGVDVKFFGDTAGAYGLWDQSADKFIVRGPTGTGTATPGTLRLETAELTVVDGDQLGKIEFIAPLEGSGTDAILVAASIYAEADDTFDTDNNDTDLVFATGKSEAAAEKMRLNSDGDLNTAGKITAVGSFVIGSADMSEADLEKLDGITNGTAAANKALVLDASRDVDTINALGIASMANNWTNAGRTVADMGTLTTVDINGGSVDGTVIGAAAAAAGSFTAVVGTTANFSSTLNAEGATTLAALTMDGAFVTTSTMSGSSTLRVKGASTFGPGNGVFLIDALGHLTSSGECHFKLGSGGGGVSIDVNGLTSAMAMSGSSTLRVKGASTFGSGNGLATVSAAGHGSFVNLDASGDLTVATITNSEFTVDASGNTDIDGTLNVEGIPTFQAQSVHSAGATFASQGLAACGAIAGATSIDASGDLTVGTITNAEFTVDVSGNTDIDGTLNVEGVPTFQAAAVFSSGITTAGVIGGGTTLALTGLASVASISMDDGSTLGPDSVADLWTFNADGDTIQKDGAYDFNLASHDGTNGLKLGGVLVNASAADLNFTNVAAAGTAEASKALVVDGSRDIDTINALGIASMANNWTNASRTVADMGILTTVDINGGSVDGAIIGAASAALGKFTALSASAGIELAGALASGYSIDCNAGIGGVRADEFVTYSDRSLKTNIQKMDGALEKVMKLQPTTYEKVSTGRSEIGFIAQDVAKVVPEICALDAAGEGRGIDYSRMSTLLVGALKAQQEQIAQLKEIVSKLQK